MRVVLAEPWFGGSHRAWAEGFAEASRHQVSIVGLAPTLWRWRLRAGAAPLAAKIAEQVAQDGHWPDVVMISGLVDVAALLGHLRPPPDLPVVVYMHESQLVYPTADGGVDGEAVLRNWDSWLAADSVWFNSGFHRDAVVAALPAWAAAQPEPIPGAVVGTVIDRFEVHPVGVTPPRGTRANPGVAPVLLWPHRWEPDKAPDVFARAIDKLGQAGIAFELILAGDDPAQSDARRHIVELHGHRVIAAGPFPKGEYDALLHRADIVVSCAEHEFFGIAVVEAMLAGCVPLLPNRLSYPEVVPTMFHDAVLYEPGSFGSALRDAVVELPSRRTAVHGLSGALSSMDWQSVAVGYDRRLRDLALGSDEC